MKIDERHKELLIKLGLKEEDFDLFDEKFVKYEYDEQKGVRIYDPYYRTSYNEYMGIDGWSSWSSEEDTFMTDVLEKVHKEVDRIKQGRPPVDTEEIPEAIKKKFEKKK